jgi:hypothetical protein
MAGYVMYRTLMDRWAKMFAKTLPKKVRKQHRDDFLKFVMQTAWQVPHIAATIESNVLIDEEAYLERGCRVYFPDNPALLEMLWKARMNVDLEDLDLEKLPSAFGVAWPRCEIDGVQLRGCLVSIASNEQRAKVAARFGRKYLGRHLGLTSSSDIPFSEVGVHVTYMGDNIDGPHTAPVYRCALPNSYVRDCMMSASNFKTFLEERRCDDKTWDLSMKLDDEEARAQYVITRLSIRLLVYMQACPEMVHEGYPDGRKAREFSSPNLGKVKPVRLNSPLHGTHASPSAHWRNPHFRSYPRKRDGSKKKGIVCVKGTVVKEKSMGLLCWDKPKKKRPTKAHNEKFQSDSGVDGTYVPNMSEDDKLKWKAKKIGGKDPRIEIRKTTEGTLHSEPTGHGFDRNWWEGRAQALLVVRWPLDENRPTVTFSSNGKAEFDLSELRDVLQEAEKEMYALRADS